MGSLQALQDRFVRPTVFTLRLAISQGRLDDALAGIVSAVAQSGTKIQSMSLAEIDADQVMYDLALLSTDDRITRVKESCSGIDGVKVRCVLDMSFESHRGGACEMRSRRPIKSNTDLRIVYTPGVGRVCKAIEADAALAREFTNVANKVAICTNGTAILGLGDIGALAGLPVMEGKSAIFWEFAGISAEPVLIDTKDADEFINVMEKLACGFGAIQVEDVAAPECFKITRELDRRLKIPVMHDDQHGTATVVLAGLYSYLRKSGRKMTDLSCVISGAGAAGTAIADVLMLAGIADVVVLDRRGAIHRGRVEGMNPEKQMLAERTNKANQKGGIAEIMKGKELFIGVSQADLVSKDMVRSMAKDPIVMALANPVGEISVQDAYEAGAALAADGRMVNNALAYPGMFRGALDANTDMITMEMLMAAAKALGDMAHGEALMPEMMDPAVHKAVADAVRGTAGKGTPLVQ
jgi:malate dehydrogenase (oxaloacetate-decarboxylating)